MCPKLIQLGYGKTPDLDILDLEIEAMRLESGSSQGEDLRQHRDAEPDGDFLNNTTETELSEGQKVTSWLPPRMPKKKHGKYFKVLKHSQKKRKHVTC